MPRKKKAPPRNPFPKNKQRGARDRRTNSQGDGTAGDDAKVEARCRAAREKAAHIEARCKAAREKEERGVVEVDEGTVGREADNNVRCTFRFLNGDRCKRPSTRGFLFCVQHGGVRIPREQHIRYRFHTEEYNKFYKRCMADPDFLRLDGEVALIRTAAQMTLAAVNKQIERALAKNDETILARVRVTTAGLLSQISNDIGEIVTKAAKIEKLRNRSINVECIDAFLELLMSIVAQEVGSPAALSRIIMRLRSADVPTGGIRPLSDWPKGSPERTAYDRAVGNVTDEE